MVVISSTLYYGDCLKWMKEWGEEFHNSVDLIYLDPPFNSKKNYNIIFEQGNGIPAQMRAFTDTWYWDDAARGRMKRLKNASGDPLHKTAVALEQLLPKTGMLAYLTYMGERLVELRNLLKPTGSIYLHCDPTASHYLKVVMDAIFGTKGFRNEIVWCYRNMPTRAKKWQANSDTILFYTNQTKIKEYTEHTFNVLHGTYSEGTLKTYESSRKVGYNANHSRMMVTIFDEKKYRKAVTEGKIPSGMRETYFKGQGPPHNNWWSDIKILGGPKNKQRLDFPTQKPDPLLERIIKASSNPGDLVLDPFCGSGTTLAVAEGLGRQWVGIDISARAIELVSEKRFEPRGVDHSIHGMPADFGDARKLAREKPFEFEEWAVTRTRGFVPNDKQVGDKGVDGRGQFFEMPEGMDSKVVVSQVKGSPQFRIKELREFVGAMGLEKAAAGIYITLHKVDNNEAREIIDKEDRIIVDSRSYPRLQMWSIEEYFQGKMPYLPLFADPISAEMIEPKLI